MSYVNYQVRDRIARTRGQAAADRYVQRASLGRGRDPEMDRAVAAVESGSMTLDEYMDYMSRPGDGGRQSPTLVPMAGPSRLVSSGGFGGAGMGTGGTIGTIGGVIGGLSGIGDVWGAIKGAWTGRKPPTSTPGLPALPPPPTTPTPGIPGTIQRWLPGGKTGYQHGAIEQAFAPVVEPVMEQRLKCPKGYVAVTLPDGSRACMLKVLATRFGFWKSRPKPPVSGWDMKAIRRADRAQKRVKKLAGQVGFTTTKKGTSRRKSGGRKKC